MSSRGALHPPARLRTWSARTATLEPADSATISNLSGFSATMSSVWVPMEPVEPSSENFCGAGSRRGGRAASSGYLRPCSGLSCQQAVTLGCAHCHLAQHAPRSSAPHLGAVPLLGDLRHHHSAGPRWGRHSGVDLHAPPCPATVHPGLAGAQECRLPGQKRGGLHGQ